MQINKETKNLRFIRHVDWRWEEINVSSKRVFICQWPCICIEIRNWRLEVFLQIFADVSTQRFRLCKLEENITEMDRTCPSFYIVPKRSDLGQAPIRTTRKRGRGTELKRWPAKAAARTKSRDVLRVDTFRAWWFRAFNWVDLQFRKYAPDILTPHIQNPNLTQEMAKKHNQSKFKSRNSTWPNRALGLPNSMARRWPVVY